MVRLQPPVGTPGFARGALTSSIMLPEDLTSRFFPVRELPIPAHAGREAWLTREAGSGSLAVVKLSLRDPDPGHGLLNRLRTWIEANPEYGPNLNLPQEGGQTADGRYYEVSAYFHAGSVADVADRVREQREGLARQCLRLLEALHGTPEGPLVHGDIKPSNILVSEDPNGLYRFAMSDFEAARQFDRSTRTGGHPTRYSLRYAAPEVIGGGEVTPAIDYWSLGMALLECISGAQPLAGMSEPVVRALLSGTWRPPQISQISDVRWRALISGLLDRNPLSRWGSAQCRRWLAGDLAVISEGLDKLDEPSSTLPYDVDGIPVVSTRNLAQALIERWAAGRLSEAGLSAWLRDQLNRDDLAAHLARLGEDTALSPDMKLLHFCHSLYAGIPVLWRGRALSGGNLEAAAQAAAAGDIGSLEWLQSLADGAAFEFYGQYGHAEAEALGRRYTEGWAAYRQAWSEIIAAGAPETARPADAQALPILVQTLFSDSVQADLRASAQDFLNPVNLLLREPWFLLFGSNIESMGEERLLVLRHLDQVSRLSPQQIGVLDELGNIDSQRFAEGAVFLETQRRLMQGMHAGESASITVLNAGESHRSRPNERLADFIEIILRHAGRIIRRLLGHARDWALRTLRIPRPAGDDTDLWIQLRMVRLAASGVAEGMPLGIEAYLAMISWRVAEGLRPRLRITYPSFLLAYPRLVTPVLAGQGHLLLVLSSDSRIQLAARRHWYQMRRKTEGINVLFRDTPVPIAARGGLIRSRTQIRDAAHPDTNASHRRSQSLTETKGKILGLDGRIRSVIASLAKARIIGDARVASARSARAPSLREQNLWNALLGMLRPR